MYQILNFAHFNDHGISDKKKHYILQDPSETMYQILNFVFFNDRSISDQKKQTLSTRYERTFKLDYAQEYSVHYSRSSRKNN